MEGQGSRTVFPNLKCTVRWSLDLMTTDMDLGLIFKDTLLDLGLSLRLLIFKVWVLDLVIWALGKRSEL